MEEKKKVVGITPKTFAVSVVFSIGFISFVQIIWPNAIPFSLWEAWTVHGNFWKGVGAYWPLFIYGFVLQAGLIAWRRKVLEPLEVTSGEYFVRKCGKSLWAGFTEEIIYRWLGFLGAIAFTKFFNVILFGFIAWFYGLVLGPLADFATLGQLHPFLYHEMGWWFGAALLSANSSFRDGHKYQGLLGLVNSWFGGMILFHCLFTYGLPVAIVVHASYNISTNAAMAAFYPMRN